MNEAVGLAFKGHLECDLVLGARASENPGEWRTLPAARFHSVLREKVAFVKVKIQGGVGNMPGKSNNGARLWGNSRDGLGGTRLGLCPFVQQARPRDLGRGRPDP